MGHASKSWSYSDALNSHADGLLSKTSFYDHERMMNKISYQAGKLRPATNVNEYLVILEDIYNYKATAKYAISFPRIHKRKI
jgi:hypothetical protein